MIDQDRIDALLDSTVARLSPWEIDFLESLNEQVRAGRNLSPRQLDKLEKIEERVGG